MNQEQAAASLSNATPALLPPTIDCHRKQPDGRLCHRNPPFVLVGATDWVCPECMDRPPFASEVVLSEVADMYPAC